MKIRRHKKAQRILTFYRNNFGFRPPFHVVLDGTFCQKALNNKINLKEQIPHYFGAEVKLLTTACILIELEKLGPALKGALAIVKQFPLRACGHEKNAISAGKCLLSLTSNENSDHYIVATQDFSVINQLAKRKCCPVLSLKGNAIHLAPPSVTSREAVQNNLTHIQDGSEDPDVVQVKQMKAEQLDDEVTIKKKRKKKGPNPLSCKKKQPKETPVVVPKKRKRNRDKRPVNALGKHFRNIVQSVNKSL